MSNVISGNKLIEVMKVVGASNIDLVKKDNNLYDCCIVYCDENGHYNCGIAAIGKNPKEALYNALCVLMKIIFHSEYEDEDETGALIRRKHKHAIKKARLAANKPNLTREELQALIDSI